MKIKIKDQSVLLPNAWKQCGLSKKDWDELQSGKEVEATSCPDYLKDLIEVLKVSPKKESK
tara:strand:+ start:362 stop:544 length:183 start_codon:yes stop_codon:yes gene_type:complete